MKKMCLSLLLMMATLVSAQNYSGVYSGTLNIGGEESPNSVLVFPGSDDQHINFILPDFSYGELNLGDIVLVNIPVSNTGGMALTDYPFYIPLLQEHVGISIVDFEEEGEVYNSAFSQDEVLVVLMIETTTLSETLPVLFAGTRQSASGYQARNAGFETWESVTKGVEPTNWNGFSEGTGTLIGTARNDKQLKSSTLTRPGSAGTKSAVITSNMVLSVKANGNLTTGRINAGSLTANDASGNYNYTDADQNDFRLPFTGHPDSLVFWTRFAPADRNASNSSNVANVKAIYHGDGDFHDPDYDTVNVSITKFAEATTNILPQSGLPWVRVAQAFDYTTAADEDTKYMLITFTTCATPGGGSTYSTGTIKKTYYYDSLYIDDVEMIYNSKLGCLTIDGIPVTFDQNGHASLNQEWSDVNHTVVATTANPYATEYHGYDPYNSQLVVIVKGEDYAQDASSYHTYTVSLQPQLSVAEEITLQQYKHKTVDVSVNGIEAASSFTWEAMQGIVTADAGIITAGKQLGDDEVILYKGEMGTELTVHVVEQHALTVSEALALCASLENGAVLPDGKYLIRGYLQQAASSGYVVGNSAPAASAPARAAAASSEVISVPSAEVLNNAGNEPTAAGQRVELVGELTRTGDGSIALTGATILGIDERNWPTGIEQTDSTGTAVRKVLINGQLLILKGDKVYNALGQEM